MDAPEFNIDHIPTRLIENAIKLGEWMKQHGYTDWVIHDCASRSTVDFLYQQNKELKAMLEAAHKALDEGVHSIRLIREAFEDFKKQAFKITTPATVDHVKDQAR